jgi:hypothetical protein
MKNTKKAIGQLKAKSTAYCTICGCSNHRTITANVYQNTPEEVEKAKAEIKEKASKKYTCKICKSIEKDLIS